METDNYFKQVKLFNPEDSQRKYYVYGLGSIGSHVVIGLAKIGIKNITVYDFDTVELSNVPAQFFSVQQGKNEMHKTESVNYMTEFMTGVTLTTINTKIDTDFEIDAPVGSVHIIAFDNIEARHIIFNKLKENVAHLIDGRIGGFNYEKYYINCVDGNEEYESTLLGEFSEQECGEKCLWGVNSTLSSLIIADVIKLHKDLTPMYCVKGNYMAHTMINKEKQTGMIENE